MASQYHLWMYQGVCTVECPHFLPHYCHCCCPSYRRPAEEETQSSIKKDSQYNYCFPCKASCLQKQLRNLADGRCAHPWGQQQIFCALASKKHLSSTCIISPACKCKPSNIYSPLRPGEGGVLPGNTATMAIFAVFRWWRIQWLLSSLLRRDTRNINCCWNPS